jgi:hypothetical protein
MAKLKSNFKYMLDAAPSITFRDGSAAALTADANTAAIVLDTLDGYWNTNNELADSTFAVVINVNQLDETTGDETYVLNLVAGPVGFATSTVVGTVTVRETGQHVILVDVDTVRKSVANAEALRIAVDVTGTTPIIDFTAFIGGAIIR